LDEGRPAKLDGAPGTGKGDEECENLVKYGFVVLMDPASASIQGRFRSHDMLPHVFRE
jgi:hypothetical protein